MPHKRAKSSVRRHIRNEKGTDLAPVKSSLQNEPIPKSAARILNAHSIREEWKQRKRKNEEEQSGRDGKRRKTGPADKKATLTIQPGESIQHFNKRVEDDLRPLIKTAVETSRATHRRTETQEKEAKAEAKKAKLKTKSVEKSRKSRSPSPEPDKHANRPKEFASASSSAPKRLNDIAQAPPEFKRLPRGASSSAGVLGKKDGVLSMSQQLMMEKEREKAIARYRELKASRRQASAGDKLGGT
ncbi:unnamed protein product [Cyclocybe aegerita]|uniref:Uncharacterized protein n=1 Tax=Cyclocybe aegerita TaxID=1973307 RepID=A0A8S0VXF5_CYCAE|nr:unnamed protein product [Cyclocybe aegerita]